MDWMDMWPDTTSPPWQSTMRLPATKPARNEWNTCLPNLKPAWKRMLQIMLNGALATSVVFPIVRHYGQHLKKGISESTWGHGLPFTTCIRCMPVYGMHGFMQTTSWANHSSYSFATGESTSHQALPMSRWNRCSIWNMEV